MDARSALNNKNRDVFADLREGETVLASSVISLGIYWKAIAVFVFALILLILSFGLYPLTIFLTLIAGLMFLFAYIQKSILTLVVTNQRIFIRAGAIKIDTVQIRVERIESVEVQKTLVGYFLGYGTVIITGVGNQFAFIPFVENSAQIRNALDEVLYERDKNLQASITQTIVSQAAPPVVEE